MKVELQAHAKFELPLTQDHIDVLMLYSSRHYDATCRSASENHDSRHFSGLLVGWRNSIAFWAESDKPECAHVVADESQIDLLQKCLEYESPKSTPEQEVLRRELQRIFAACRRQWRKLYDQWHLSFDA